jgi:hypothetical protein
MESSEEEGEEEAVVVARISGKVPGGEMNEFLMRDRTFANGGAHMQFLATGKGPSDDVMLTQHSYLREEWLQLIADT